MLAFLPRKLLFTGFWTEEEAGPETLAQQLGCTTPQRCGVTEEAAQAWTVSRQGPLMPLSQAPGEAERLQRLLAALRGATEKGDQKSWVQVFYL